MYKLLTTAAVIMAVATPSFAWTNAEELIKGLNDVYTGVDGAGESGTGHFESLQSNALGSFVGEANLGVTHVVLTVDAVDNTISASIKGGTSLKNIQNAQTNLINQVNYDLFVDTDTGSIEAYDSTEGGFTDPLAPPTKAPGTPITEIDNDGTVNWANANSGLVGVKVGKVVDSANAINNYLTGPDAAADSQPFIDAFAAKKGVFGTADIGNLFAHIDGGTLTDTTVVGGINNSINAAANAGGVFFGNIDDQQDPTKNKVDGSSIAGFSTDTFTLNPSDGKLSDGNVEYDTLLQWAQRNDG